MSAQGFSGSEGTDSNALGMPDPPVASDRWDADGREIPARAPEPERHDSAPDLSQIYSRMDQLAEQQQALVDAFQNGGHDDYDYGDEDGYVELSDEEAAQLDALAGLSPDELSELGLTPEDVEGFQAGLSEDDLAELDEIDAEHEGGGGDDVTRLAEQIHQRWQSAEDAKRAFEQRESDFEDLRERLPVLQHEPTARKIVQRAQALAERWQPGLVDQPEFVHLVEMVALGAIGQRAIGQERAERASQRDVQIESASGGGGLSHAPPPSEPDWGARVVEAANRLSARI